MDEGEAYRHRQRVVAFALFAGVCAAGFFAWPVFLNHPQHVGSSIWFDTGQNAAKVRDLSTTHITRAVPSAAVVAAILLVAAGILIETRREADDGILDPSGKELWLGAWLFAGLLSQSVGMLLRPDDFASFGPIPTFQDYMLRGVLRGIAYGCIGGLLWLVIVATFRRIDRSDAWPSVEFFGCLRGAALRALVAGCVFGITVAREQPHSESVAKELPSIGYGPNVRPVERKDLLRTARLEFEQELRERNAFRAVPAAVVIGALMLLLGAILLELEPQTRLNAVAWVFLWVLTGVATQCAAVYFRGRFWHCFAPPGTDVVDHCADMALRGALIGLTVGLLSLIPVSRVYQRIRDLLPSRTIAQR